MAHTTAANIKVGTPATVDTPSAAWIEMMRDWIITDALNGGTRAMREKGTTYLPQDKGEPEQSYIARRDRSFLFPSYASTLEKVTSKPFSQQIGLRGEDALEAPLDEIEDDCDSTGQSITQFFSGVFKNAVDRGLSHVLIEGPKTGGTQSAFDEFHGGLRPYFVHIPAESMFAWRTAFDPDTGTRKITHARWLVSRTERDGDFGEIKRNYVHVMTAPSVELHEDDNGDEVPVALPGTWQVWKGETDASGNAAELGSGAFELASEGTHTYDGLPIVTIYTKRTKMFEGSPPLMGIAWKNIEHWQKESDLSNILHIVSVAILVQTGLSENDEPGPDEPMIVGPNRRIRMSEVDGKVFFAEHSGAGIDAAMKYTADLRAEMEVQGSEPFQRQRSTATATQEIKDESKTNALILTWVCEAERLITKCYEVAARWMGRELPEDFAVDVFDDFELASRAEQGVNQVFKAVELNIISKVTAGHELKRYGVIAESVDIEAEQEAVENEIDLSVLPEPGDPEPGQPPAPAPEPGEAA